MYSETNSKNSNGIILVAVIIVFMVFLKGIFMILPVMQMIKDIVYLIIIASALYVLIKRYLSSYVYEVTDDSIIITTLLSGRDRGKLEIHFNNIEMFLPEKNERIKSYKITTRTLCTMTDLKYAIICNSDFGKLKIIFAPTDKLVKLINNKLYTTAEEE